MALMMRLFRRSLDLAHATVRPSHAADLTRVSRLLRDGAHRYCMLNGSELPELLRQGCAVVLESDNELWGVAVAGHLIADAAWLHGLAFVEGVEPRAGLTLMLPLFHQQIAAKGVAHLFYASDDTADSWLLPIMPTMGYQPETEVVVYEKRGTLIPSPGSDEVRVRPANAVDVHAITQIDGACFEAHWTKPETILGPAIGFGPLFVVAEWAGQMVGYAYATSHFGGRLVHLVRIAVLPNCQGHAVGIRLLAEVVGFARRCGAQTLTLNTQAYNLRAQRLYRWFGFAPTGERQVVLRFDLRS